MKTQPTIIDIDRKYVIGMTTILMKATDHAPELWRAFGPRKKEIQNRKDASTISMQLFGYNEKLAVSANSPVEKWACVEVLNFDVVPDGMETYTVDAGKYAAFQFKGSIPEFMETMKRIFEEWLPVSGYRFDNRAQLTIMPEIYNPQNNINEEEIWIPIVEK